jgi:hypothetical protein
MNFFTFWSLCGLAIPALHLLAALIVDRRIALGTWTRVGLALFMLLGPFGLLFEFWLLAAVFADLYAELRRAPQSQRSARRSWPMVPRRPLAKGSGLS